GCLEKAQLVSSVEAFALELDGVHWPALPQATEAVGELDLAATVGRRFGQDAEDVGRQHVPADDGEVGRRLLGAWLFHEIGDLVDAGAGRIGDRSSRNDAVLVDPIARDALGGDDRSPMPPEGAEEPSPTPPGAEPS